MDRFGTTPRTPTLTFNESQLRHACMRRFNVHYLSRVAIVSTPPYRAWVSEELRKCTQDTSQRQSDPITALLVICSPCTCGDSLCSLRYGGCQPTCFLLNNEKV